MILCPGCGADMVFDPASGKLTCSYCKKELPIEEYRKMKAPAVDAAGEKKDALEAQEGEWFEATVFTCPQCGAQLISTDETAATFCSYCGASVVLEGRITREKRPDKIIPFRVTKEQGIQSYRDLLKRSLFVPSELKSEEHIQKLRGIYMPYWIYTFRASKSFTLKGQKSHTDGNYIYTDKFDVTISPEAVYEGISFDASSLFYDDLSSGIAPFESKDSKTFDPAYMSGFYADTGDVKPETYEQQAKCIAAENAAARIMNRFPAGEYSINRDQIRRNLSLDSKAESGYFPVWFLSSRNASGDRISYAVINGQTGKITAELPISFKKYLIASLLFALPVYLLLNLFLTPTPGKMLTGAAVFAVIAILITFSQIDRVYARDHRIDDRGLSSVLPSPDKEAEAARRKAEAARKKAEEKATASEDAGDAGDGFGALVKKLLKFVGYCLVSGVLFLGGLLVLVNFSGSVGDIAFIVWMLAFPLLCIFGLARFMRGGDKDSGKKRAREVVPSSPLGGKLKRCWKQILALLLIIAILIWDPASDLYFYCAAFLSMAFTVWGFYDIISEYNLLTTRKLPQMGKRGGDENA